MVRNILRYASLPLTCSARWLLPVSAALVVGSGCIQKVALAPVDQQIEQLALIPEPLPSIPILTYHRVTDTVTSDMAVSPAQLRSQIQFLLDNGYTPVSPDDWSSAVLYGAALPPKPVLLTFDDGWKSQFVHAVPILNAFDIPATFYIYPAFIGNSSAMSWKNLRDLADAQHTVGSHSFSHPKLTQRFSFEDDRRYNNRLVREIAGSKKTIEENLGRPVRHFCYPYGYYNTNIIRHLQQARYVSAVTVNPAVNGEQTSLYSLGRLIVGPATSIAQIQAYLDSKVLPVQSLSPADGTICRNLTTGMRARLGSAANSRFDRVRVKWNWKWMESSWNPHTGIVECKLLQPVKPGSCSAQIHAWDSNSNHFIYAWQFQQNTVDTAEADAYSVRHVSFD